MEPAANHRGKDSAAWQCERCTFLNAAGEAPVCAMCQSQRPAKRRREASPPPPAAAPVDVRLPQRRASDEWAISWRAVQPNAGRAWVARGVPHCRQHDNWSCGLQSMRMLWSWLHFGAAPLTVSQVQHAIEDGWRRGFDPGGAAHYGGKLVGRRRWVGAGEAAVFFRSQDFIVRLTDFKTPEGARQSPVAILRAAAMHFAGESGLKSLSSSCRRVAHQDRPGVRLVDRSPLLLQRQGHAVVVVGVEVRTAGDPHVLPAHSVLEHVNLVVFDPRYETELSPARVSRHLVSGASLRDRAFQLVGLESRFRAIASAIDKAGTHAPRVPLV